MNTLLSSMVFFIFGGLVGVWVHHYHSRFAEHTAREVHQFYCEIYPQNPPPLLLRNAVLKPLKCGHFLKYFFLSAVFFLCCFYAIAEFGAALFFALYCTLLWTISRLDWHYHLIPLTLCQQLIALSTLAAYTQILPLSIEESLRNTAIGFIVFFLVYQGAKYYYRQEAFGRGDYWLIAGLSGFIPWSHIPLMIFIACTAALLYAFWLKRHLQTPRFIPFAPFLSLGGLFTFYCNNVSIHCN